MRYVREPFDEFKAAHQNSEKKELFKKREMLTQLRAELDQKRKIKAEPAELAEIRENIELMEKKKPLRTIIRFCFKKVNCIICSICYGTH